MWGSVLSFYQRQAARRMFARWSPIYELEVAENFYSAADCAATHAVRHLAACESQDLFIVDCGIGTGLLAQQIKEALPCSITGLDFSADMLSICAAKEIAYLLIQCDVGKDIWPLPDASQNAVVSAGLLEYLTPEMLQHFLQQTARILHKNGLLIFTYLPSDKPEKVGLWHGHSGTYLTCAYAPDHMETLLKAHGMSFLEHTDPFKGCLFLDGSSYDYRLIAAVKS